MPPPSAPLRAQSSPSSHQPLPRCSEDGLSGESRALGCALPLAQSSRSLQQQPQRRQLESKRLSQDVFSILFLVTSAFTLHVSPGCPSSVGLGRVREAQGWPRPELSLSPTFWGSEGHPTTPSSQHLTVCSVRNQPPPGLSQGRDTWAEMHYLGQNSAPLAPQRAEPSAQSDTWNWAG